MVIQSLGDFRGPAKRLDDVDLPKIAHRIGVGEDELHAVMDVETSGTGFRKDGSLQRLFEPHIFYRELGPGQKRDLAVKRGVAYPKWNPRGYAKNDEKFAIAYSIDPDAAIRATSWGFGQIMGFNARLAGYETAEQMVRHFLEDEEHHINAMVTFIINAGLAPALRRHDFRAFARGYNGAAYEANGYHLKLASRFAYWQKKRDTPWSPDVKVPPRTKQIESSIILQRGDRSDAVKALQKALNVLGYDAGRTDGIFGALTEAAVKRFQADHDLLVDGWVGDKTKIAIGAALKRNKSEPAKTPLPPTKIPEITKRPTEVIEDELRKRGSRTINGSDEVKEKADSLKELARKHFRDTIGKLIAGGTPLAIIGALFDFLKENPWIIAVLIAVAVLGFLYFEWKQSRVASQTAKIADEQKVVAEKIAIARVDDAIMGVR
ncbi:N-acetylmuramidase domain-containing protein [Notoacmeibacter sp. MSK16QG-6]|uniref:N-acetylmuramidase domain-containing protein n=1 Tax=Notoacmeibacter sp. MSK16QG-6 TaxID=2957982 RepID=UPI00209E0237|nr:N-acetylmuramidase domain-containing protein [Notoacmeibacter sp. MSK16QG-6]MCP1200044.1 N-acetylmuramidase domain-containing protein [Notoacmeibacter sp. MSK16QG-6]